MTDVSTLSVSAVLEAAMNTISREVQALEQTIAGMPAGPERNDLCHEQRLASAAWGVVDYLRRVTTPDASDHYRAEKAGNLLLEAAALDRITFARLAQVPAVEALLDADSDALVAQIDGHRAAAWRLLKVGE